MLSGDLCKRSTPRAELDQRARDTRLGLERIERLVVRHRTDASDSGKTSSFPRWHILGKIAA